MTLWQNLDMSERIAAVQTTAANKNIEDRAVEKDWWVTAVLKALFSTSCSDYLLFKRRDLNQQGMANYRAFQRRH